MARLLTLALLLALGSLQAQAVTMNWSKGTDPQLPLKFETTQGHLIKVEYSNSTHSPISDGVLLQVTMERKDGSEKETFSLVVPPVGTEEIGLIQGWIPKPGDKVHIAATGHSSIDFGNL